MAGFDDLERAVRRRFGAAARIENAAVPTLGAIARERGRKVRVD